MILTVKGDYKSVSGSGVGWGGVGWGGEGQRDEGDGEAERYPEGLLMLTAVTAPLMIISSCLAQLCRNTCCLDCKSSRECELCWQCNFVYKQEAITLLMLSV
jgi:hypothetical protein